MELRPLKEKDVDGMLEWMHDVDINRLFATDFGSFSREKVLAFIQSASDESNDVHRACVDDNDEYLGTVSLKNIDADAHKAEYAVSFRKCAHGSGAARFATLGILDYGFRELGLKRIYLNVLSDNARANRFYQKMGFIFEGTFTKHLFVDGALRDLNWYRMLSEDFFRCLNRDLFSTYELCDETSKQLL